MNHPPTWEIVTLCLLVLGTVLGYRVGVVAGTALMINVLIAGFLAFNFFEPLARFIGFLAPRLDEYADSLSIVVLASGVTVGLLLATRRLCQSRLSLPPLVQKLGGGAAGLLAGYLAAGILICTLQTLPVGRNLLGYDPDQPLGLGAPDRAWLALVHRASGVVFDYHGDGTRWFDADGSFIERYARYRRRDPEVGASARHRGEFTTPLPTQPGDAE
jgi:hypothetical protein